jgi:hypothetical protein
MSRLKDLFHRVRPNAEWDLIKSLFWLLMAWALYTFYHIVSWLAGVPRHIKVDVGVLVALSLLTFGLFVHAKYRRASTAHKTLSEPPKESPPVATEEAEEKAPARQTNVSDERIVTNVTPEYLSGFFREHLNTQARALIKPFTGKWMKASGFVRDVTDHGLYTMVHLDTVKRTETQKTLEDVGREVAQVSLSASSDKQKYRDRFKVLGRGEKITVFGKIVEADAFHVTLAECEIIKSDSTD